ncbi:MAG TPA: hypothetical protein GX707_01220 [Epulopiscium sp.]|nr:hypothetical protein [Candidatus Epulonipiscium sp.]
MSCGRCGNNQVGGTQAYPCQRELDKLKRDLRELERCLLAAAEETRPRRCHCCCCCCRQNGNTNGNQTSWGR